MGLRAAALAVLAGCRFAPTSVAVRDGAAVDDAALAADGSTAADGAGDGAPLDGAACWSLTLDGDAWVDAPFAAPYDQQTAWSMGAWAKLDAGASATGEYHIASHHSDGLNTGYVLMFKGGLPEFRVYHPGGTSCQCKPDPPAVAEDMIVPGRWHHLAASFDSGTALLFLDGRLSRTCVNDDTYANCYDVTAAPYGGPFWIGAASDAGGEFGWVGAVKDVWIDDEPLGSLADPRTHVACDGAGDAFFGMTEGSGDTIVSSCTTASTGTFGGMGASRPVWTLDCPP